MNFLYSFPFFESFFFSFEKKHQVPKFGNVFAKRLRTSLKKFLDN